MTETTFDRDAMARHYAEVHAYTDPGTVAVYHLPAGAGEREIRLLEVNDQIVERDADPQQPLDFGAERYATDGHKLVVINMTPRQWSGVEAGEIDLAAGWSLAGMARLFPPPVPS